MSDSILVGGSLPHDTPISEPGEDSGLLSWVASVDHKQIGLLYIYTALFFFIVGGVEALLIRLQLAVPNNTLLSPQAFNQLFTMHGTTMIFFVVMPIEIGLGNYLIPLMIGARDMAFPRVNAFGFWMLLFGGIILYYSTITGGAPDAGWFSYPPLALPAYSSSTGVDYFAIGLLLSGIGTVTAGINFIVTIITMRAPGMKITEVPLFVWMMFVTSFLIVFALPALNAALIMLLVDRLLNGHFFGPEGSPVLWQHFFWAFGHPEVYIMALPGFGMISEVIPVMSRKPIFGYRFVYFSSIAIGFLSFGVWAHHMFAVGLWNSALIAFGASSMLIAVPTGVKIFNWIATMHGGKLRLNTAMLFCIAFLIQFTIGGMSGVMFAVVPIDWATTDSYFVVAHFHYVLFGGILFGIMAGAYYWFPKMSGRMLSERWGRWNFWLMVIGFNGTFFVQHVLGLIGMPRRVASYPDLPWWGALNMISTVGAFILGLSILVFLVNVVISVRHGAEAGNDPWDAWTLEWLTTSPPPHHNFSRVPRVRSSRPLWDIKNPDLADWKVDHD
jgi:cytochrome c oxidase subunit 1/cytochrome c oxidase subunit I+III